jgi:hypothetical protein
MRRVHLELNDEQAIDLDRRSASTGKSVATLILELVDAKRMADERQRRIDVALAALEKPPFRSGLTDVAENHDDYIGQILDEEVERWRRS